MAEERKFSVMIIGLREYTDIFLTASWSSLLFFSPNEVAENQLWLWAVSQKKNIYFS